MAKISSLKQAIAMFSDEVELELRVEKLSTDFPDYVVAVRFYHQGKIYGTLVCVEDEEGLESCCYHGKHPFLDETPKGHVKRESLRMDAEAVTPKPDYPELKEPETYYLRGDSNDIQFLGTKLSKSAVKIDRTEAGKYLDKLERLRKV